MNLPLVFAVIAIGDFASGKVARLVKLPMITGYLVAGIVMGPTVSGLLSEASVADANVLVTPIGLGIIAYLIGGSLPMAGIREGGRSIPAIVLMEALFACLFVIALVTVVGPILLDAPDLDTQDFVTMGILAGAISLATAPAATLALIEEAGTRGRLVRTLLAVVAIDDGLAIIAFAIAASVIAMLYGTDGSFSTAGLFLAGTGGVAVSIVLGLVAGALVIWLTGLSRARRQRHWLMLAAIVAIRLMGLFRWRRQGHMLARAAILVTHLASSFQGRRQRRWLMLAAIVALTGLANGLNDASDVLDLSPVMANMVLGFVVINRHPHDEQLVDLVRDFEDLVFVLFFTLAGTHLDFAALGSASVIAALITLGRMTGKFSGAWLGATVSGAPPVVRRYLGFTLLPKAGITLGLALLIVEQPQYETISTVLFAGVLGSTLINELIAPPIAKLALVRAQAMEDAEQRLIEATRP